MQFIINTPGTFITRKDGCFRLKQEKVFNMSPYKTATKV
jgi:hypothetical protein